MRFIPIALATALLWIASATCASAETLHCVNGYCTQGPYAHMTMQLARQYTLQYERRYLAPEIPARDVRVGSCRWHHAPFTAHCSVQVRMALLVGERGRVTVSWVDAVNRRRLVSALPWTGRVIGVVRLPSPRERVSHACSDC